MELALVKSQINPHFLFNTINNIDVLIEKDPPTASRYLNKLSDILRFMLYEAKTDKIPLVKELTYIEKYIDLQRIRTANPDYVDYSFTGVADHIMIEPMLFIPFIENAFKHAENKKLENTIHIRVAAGDHELSFACENKFNDPGPGRSVRAGLGNELIQRRLNLLYPGKHRLEIRVGEQTYKVKLSIYHEGH
jgi:two-component system, LytTR family, sensor kinase